MGDAYWRQPATIPEKRPRTEFDIPGGHEFPSHMVRDDERAAQHVVRDTNSIQVSYDQYLRSATVPSLVPAPDSNGYKDPRSKEDSFVTVRDRKVRVSASSSLYAACRSWLRNGVSEETQPHYLDGIKLLPKPSPPPVPDAHSPAEPTKEEEEEESIEHLSPKDLLKRHVKRAKKVRARLRDERLQRIARYKTRLALLLPPLVEQHQFRNESAAGN